MFALKEHIPVKQGLRLLTFSILPLTIMSQRAYSSKTRIKTMTLCVLPILTVGLKEHIPVKQGLRRSNGDLSFSRRFLKEHIPVKQGLRLFFSEL